jgi:hypothetical protein
MDTPTGEPSAPDTITIPAEIAYRWASSHFSEKADAARELRAAIEATRPEPWIKWKQGLSLCHNHRVVTCVEVKSDYFISWPGILLDGVVWSQEGVSSTRLISFTVEFDPKFWSEVEG